MYYFIKKIFLHPAFLICSKFFPEASTLLRSKIKEKMEYKRNYKLNDGLPRLLVDVSIITDNDAGTGIQRVVNSLSKEFVKRITDHFEFVKLTGKRLITSYKYLSKFFPERLADEEYLELNTGDVLFLLDSSWDRVVFANEIIDKIHQKNGKVYAIIHDLFPIQYPELFDSKQFIDVFVKWHNLMLRKCDGVICVSKTTADVVKSYYIKQTFNRTFPLNVYYFHLGVKAPSIAETEKTRVEICDFVNRGNVFLMVGTVEPRKGHAVVVEAFQQLIEQGHNVRLLLIGKDGWKNNKFKELIANSSDAFKERFLWIKDASDSELCWAYKNTLALIAASQDEGFGLPLIEAGYFELPLICSDIPIFREVAGANATYFEKMNPYSLIKTISEWLNMNNHPNSKHIKIYSWDESAEEVLDIINQKVTPYLKLS